MHQSTELIKIPVNISKLMLFRKREYILERRGSWEDGVDNAELLENKKGYGWKQKHLVLH